MTDEERKALNAIGKHEAAPAVTEREKLLDEAKAIVCGDRDQQYGRPEENFGIIAELWSNYLRHSVSSRDVAMMMILFKVAREATGRGKRDSLIDIAGYAACAAECEASPQSNKDTLYGDGVACVSVERK